MTDQSPEYANSLFRLVTLWENVWMIEERGIDEIERRRRLRCAIADFSSGELNKLNLAHQNEISKLKGSIKDLKRACAILTFGMVFLSIVHFVH